MRNVDPDAISDEELVAQIHMVYSSNEVTGTNLEESEDQQEMIICYQN